MKIMGAALVAATLAFGSAASASVMTFDFDDANNGQKSYSKYNFTFDPTNFNSGQCFQPVDNGNGSCFHEVKNGDPTFLTEDSGSSYDLLSFFFNLEGKGGTAPNTQYFEVVGDNGKTVRFDFLQDYTTVAGVSIFEYSYDKKTGAQSLSSPVGKLSKNTDYFVLFDNIFDGVKQISFDPSETAQVRIDCVSVSTDGSNQTKDGLTSCKPTLAPVPLPASAMLLIGGIGGLGGLGALRKLFRRV